MNDRASPPATGLFGRWLLLARVAWVAVAITALAIDVFSVPISFEQYRTVCTAAAEVCSTERAVEQPTPEGVQTLREAGLSLRSYAAMNVAIGTVFPFGVACRRCTHLLEPLPRPNGALGFVILGDVWDGNIRPCGC
jgi:hypothetical protein